MFKSVEMTEQIKDANEMLCACNQLNSELAGKNFGGVEWNPLSFGRWAPYKFSKYIEWLKKYKFYSDWRALNLFINSRGVNSKYYEVYYNFLNELQNNLSNDNSSFEHTCEKFICSYYQKVIDNSESEDDKECFIKRKSFPLCRLFDDTIAGRAFILRTMHYYMTYMSRSYENVLQGIADFYSGLDQNVFAAETKIFSDAAKIENELDGVYYAWTHMGFLYYARSSMCIGQGKNFQVISNFVANRPANFIIDILGENNSDKVKKASAF